MDKDYLEDEVADHLFRKIRRRNVVDEMKREKFTSVAKSKQTSQEVNWNRISLVRSWKSSTNHLSVLSLSMNWILIETCWWRLFWWNFHGFFKIQRSVFLLPTIVLEYLFLILRIKLSENRQSTFFLMIIDRYVIV